MKKKIKHQPVLFECNSFQIVVIDDFIPLVHVHVQTMFLYKILKQYNVFKKDHEEIMIKTLLLQHSRCNIFTQKTWFPLKGNLSFTAIIFYFSTLQATFVYLQFITIRFSPPAERFCSTFQLVIIVTPDFADVQYVRLSHSLKHTQIVLVNSSWFWINPCYQGEVLCFCNNLISY